MKRKAVYGRFTKPLESAELAGLYLDLQRLAGGGDVHPGNTRPVGDIPCSNAGQTPIGQVAVNGLSQLLETSAAGSTITFFWP